MVCLIVSGVILLRPNDAEADTYIGYKKVFLRHQCKAVTYQSECRMGNNVPVLEFLGKL